MIKKNYAPTVEQVLDKPNQFVLDFKELNNQITTEFNRYKQDCRKRALDLASQSLGESRKNGTFDAGAQDKEGKQISKEASEDIYLIALADRYYNWLISIPE